MAWISARGTEAYANEVQKILKQIEGNVVGKLVAGALYRSSRDVVIRALSEYKGPGPKQCRAVAGAENPVDAAPRGVGGPKAVGIRDKLYVGSGDHPDTDDDDERYKTADPKHVGMGLGSKTLVYFTPGEWGPSGCFSGASGALPDEVLVHELMHAVRNAQGVSNPVPTRNTSYHNDEEFLAIVVTNVYISSKNPSRPLVANHFDYSRLWPPLDTSKGFVDDRENNALLEHYLNVAKWSFLQDVAKLKTVKFNPFHEFVNRPKPRAVKPK